MTPLAVGIALIILTWPLSLFYRHWYQRQVDRLGVLRYRPTLLMHVVADLPVVTFVTGVALAVWGLWGD